uniref:hypothetical protein n=1 Tax=Rheinheimera sp. TaxID=1869214 RepID=UPI0040487247
MKKTLLAITITLAAGCASTPKTPPVQTKNYSIPEINTSVKVTLGERMLMQATGYYTDSITVQALDAYAADIPATTIFYRIPGSNAFQSIGKNTVVINNGYGAPLNYVNTIRFDDRADKFCIQSMLCYTSKEASFSHDPNKELRIEANSLQQVIEYNGKSGDTLKFTYREFSDSTARAAFTTDFTMDLNEGKEIGYKGAIISVEDASNSHITYRVLKNFNI